MRFLIPLLLTACYVGYAPDDYGRDRSESYAQSPDHCERPPAPSGPTGPTAPTNLCGKTCVVDCDCPEALECRGTPGEEGRECRPPGGGECPKPECTKDSDCAADKVCEAEKCIGKCVNDASCAEGLRCFEDAHCGKACCFDSDCTADQACKVGRCEKK